MRALQFILTAMTASSLMLAVSAEDAAKPKTDRPERSRLESSQEKRTDRLNGAVKASELIGMKVTTSQDEKLGTVDDLLVDMESGRVVQVILSSGGFIGMGSSLSAVPPGALHYDATDEVLHLNADKAKLESAPKFDGDNWAEANSSKRLDAMYRHYGEERAFNFVDKGENRRDAQSSARQAMIPSERLGKIQRASELIGMTVRNRQDENLGDVDNILVDLPSGRLVAVVLSSGGFLGMGNELSAVPPTALGFSSDRDSLQLDTSKEMMSNAPHFKADQWPDFSEPEYAGGVYRAYQVEPYFKTDGSLRADKSAHKTDKADKTAYKADDKARKADNTGRNVRDRDSATLTPFDQGNSKSDVATTAQIRKEIIALDDMSLNARNVKIVTVDGRVTLRGPVDSAEEKRIIGEIANRVARSGRVDNQLEVNLKTTSK